MPRKFCEPEIPGTAHAEREALQRVGVGGHRRDGVRDLVTAEDERVVRLIEVERRTTVEAHAERVRALQLEVHDDRLDEHLPARLIEAIDDGPQRSVVTQRRRDDDRVRGLVGRDLHAALEDARGLRGGRRSSLTTTTTAALGRRRVRAGDDVGEGLGELGGVRVLQRQDVDLALAGLRDVDAFDQLEDAQVRALGGDDDERVRAIVGHDLRDVQIADGGRDRRAGAAGLARRGRAAGGSTLDVEQLVDALLDVARGRVVHRLDEDLIAARADVDLLEDLHHPADVRAGVGEDDHVRGAVDGDVGLLGLELPEHVRRVVGADVAEAVHAGDEAILVRRALRCAVDGRALVRDLVRLDDLEEATVRNDGEPVRLEDGEERLVRLGDGDLLRRVNRRLDVLDLAAEDEPLAGELRNDAHELGEVGVLEGERDAVVRATWLELERILELPERGRVGRGLRARRALAERTRRRHAGRAGRGSRGAWRGGRGRRRGHRRRRGSGRGGADGSSAPGALTRVDAILQARLRMREPHRQRNSADRQQKDVPGLHRARKGQVSAAVRRKRERERGVRSRGASWQRARRWPGRRCRR